jgi:hypothetical protein
MDNALLLLRITKTKGYKEMDALRQDRFLDEELKANMKFYHLFKRAWERMQAADEGVVDKTEKRGLVDSFMSGYEAATHIAEPSAKTMHIVVPTHAATSRLVVVLTDEFSRANISPLSMGSISNVFFSPHPHPSRCAGGSVTYRTTHQKHNDEQIGARQC